MRFRHPSFKLLGLLSLSTLLLPTLESIPLTHGLLATPPAIAQTLPQGDALLDAGQQKYERGELREALTLYQQALTTFQKGSGDTAEQLKRADGAGTAMLMVGLIYGRLGQYQQALDTLDSALKLHQTTLERASKAEGQTAVQVFFRSRGKVRSAMSFLALVYTRLAQNDKALDLAQESLARSGRGPADYPLDGEIFNQIGTTYAQQGKFSAAIAAYYQAMVMVEEAGYPFGRDISKGGKPINVIEANTRIYSNQRPSESEMTEFLERSLRLDYHNPVRMHSWARYVYAITLNNIGDTYRRMGRPQARQFYLRARDASRFAKSVEQEAVSLNNVGLAYDQLGQPKPAQEFYQQALEVSRKLGDRGLEGKILTNLGASLLQTQNLAQATETLQAGLTALESLRPGLSDSNFVSLFDTQTQTYELLQRALIAQQQFEPALAVAERSRARAFVEMLARRLRPVERSNQLVQALTTDQIRQVAKTQNATLIEYAVIGNESLYIWVIKPNGEIVFRQQELAPFLSAQPNLSEYIERVRLTGLRVRGRDAGAPLPLETGSDRPTSAQLQKLYTLLIAPIADQLPPEPNARLVFIPQNALFLVPFAALQNASGQYLIEQYRISIAPSIQALQLTQTATPRSPLSDRRKTTTTPSALVVGNPTMPAVRLAAGQPPEKLSDLPGAEAEAKAIAALLRVQPLTRNQATERAVVQEMSNHRVIHLATHGLLDDFKGLGIPGAIALAPNSANPQPNDGLLTANEILDLKLNADLVVLSACDTGRGRITGEGVIGLSRSLLLAGTSNVLVSLWAVPDESTAILMTQFYQELLTAPDKASALRQAMLKTLKQYPQPRSWAAFVLIGNGD